MIFFLLIALRPSSAMPGTVQVSILELKGLPPSSSSSSPTSLKVSMGKQEYETQEEKGEFTFSLTTLRDNLIVKIQDDKGNEIAHTGLESRLIAEKGFWDDIFPLEGGGQVHMRLTFSLSEEEQKRIRNMRESALRKKREELLNKGYVKADIELASSGGKNLADNMEESASPIILLKADSFNLPQGAISKEPNSIPTSVVEKSSTPSSHPTSSKEAILSPIYLSNVNMSSLQQGGTPKEPDSKPTTISELNQPSTSFLQITSRTKESPPPTILMKSNSLDLKADKFEEGSFKPASGVNVPSTSSYHLKNDHIQFQPPKGIIPSMKTSSHVRKMIKAFDNSRSVQQDVSQGNPTTSVSPTTGSISGAQTEKSIPENIIKHKPKSAISKLKGIPSAFLADVSQEYCISSREKKVPEATTITMYRSKSLSRIYNETELENASVTRSDNTKLSNGENFSISRGVEHKGKQSSIEIRRSTSLDRYSDLDISKSQSYSSLVVRQCPSDASVLTESSRGNNATLLQDVTMQKGLSSASEHNSPVGSCDWIFMEEETCPCIVVGGNIVVGHLTDHSPKLISESYQAKVSRGDNLSREANKHEESEDSSDNGGRGPAGQVMKVVIMVGFGLLVLFTRQRKSK